jgi:hypothetical protein
VSGSNKVIIDTEAPDPAKPPSLSNPKESPTSKSMPVAAKLLAAPLLLIAAAATASGVYLLQSHASSWLAPAAFVTGAFFLISGAVVPLGVIRESSFEAAEQESCRKDCTDLYWALDAIGNRTLKGFAWVNFKQLRTFTVIAQKQARMSYYASLAAAAISLLVLTAGTAVAVGSPATAGKVTAGALATAGTVLSGFLVRTFLKAYQMASRQMSYYYGQPLVHCYLLHAEWLTLEAGKHFGAGAELCLWEKVVDASIKAGADAQEHLLSMQEPEPKKRDTGSARHPKPPQPKQASQQPPTSYTTYTTRSSSEANHETLQPHR